MPDYQKMYFLLLKESAKAIDLLQNALLVAEEMYINAPETPIHVLHPEDEDNTPPSIH